jgi:hypothetical protein
MNGLRRVHDFKRPKSTFAQLPTEDRRPWLGLLDLGASRARDNRGWQIGGPVLPIEFSRVSNDGRLTLVVDEKNGVDVPTRYILSSRTDMAGAIENLRVREKAPSDRGIGVFDRSNELRNDHAMRSAPAVYSRISAWATECAMDGVKWTAIPPPLSWRERFFCGCRRGLPGGFGRTDKDYCTCVYSQCPAGSGYSSPRTSRTTHALVRRFNRLLPEDLLKDGIYRTRQA